jgi:hypothetical protein
MSRVRNRRGGAGAGAGSEGEAGETLIHDGDEFVGPLTVAVRADHLHVMRRVQREWEGKKEGWQEMRDQ